MCLTGFNLFFTKIELRFQIIKFLFETYMFNIKCKFDNFLVCMMKLRSATLCTILLICMKFNTLAADVIVTHYLPCVDSLVMNRLDKGLTRLKSTSNLPIYSSSKSFNGIVIPFFEIVSVDYQNTTYSEDASFDNSLVPTDIVISHNKGVSGNSTIVNYWFSPYVKDASTGKVKKVKSISIRISTDKYNSPDFVTQSSSVLSSGEWYKMEVIKPGVYKISNKFLKKNGVEVRGSIRVFTGVKSEGEEMNSNLLESDLKECAIQYFIGNDGVFNDNDFALFWAEPSDTWVYNKTEDFFDRKADAYASRNYYYLLIGDGTPKQIEGVESLGDAGYETTSYTMLDFHEQNNVNIHKSGREWFESLRSNAITFDLKDVLPDKCKVKARVVGHSYSSYTVKMQAGTSTGQGFYNANTDEGYTSKTISTTFLPSGEKLPVSFSVSGGGSEVKAYLDYITINARASLQYSENALLFRDQKSLSAGASRYVISSPMPLTVWNITKSSEPKNIKVEFHGQQVRFAYPSTRIEEFVAFSIEDCYTPTFKGKVENQNLHGLSNIDMIIISADNYVTHSQRLSNVHSRYDGLTSAIVTQDQVFNEFSGGRVNAVAIRNFVRHVYFSGNKRLKYLMLVGDGSYDNINLDVKTNIITFQSQMSIQETSSYVADDFFSLLDQGEGANAAGTLVGLLDIAQGRLPVETLEEAEIVTKKIEGYVSDSRFKGQWRNKILFLADDADEDQTFHMTQASELANQAVEKNKNIQADKIFLDAYQQVSVLGGQRYPTVNKLIESKIKNGCLLFNYTGHGNPLRMTGEVVVSSKDVDKWENPFSLPLFITASCQIGRFDDKTRKSLGEEILLKGNGGSIAMMTTTRLVYAAENFQLNQHIIDTIFTKDKNGEQLTLGDVMKCAKNRSVGDFDNKYNFTLLGDPALKLSVPRLKVKTDRIIDNATGLLADTIRAFSHITVYGHVEQERGAMLPDYNGTVVLSVLDKPRNVKTLNNDGGGSVSYSIQDNIVFRGKAHVINGAFSISFIVPKDIFYHYGKGRLSYYCDGIDGDGAGNYVDFVIGGASSNKLDDKEGPEIDVFMNDTSFVYGGTTDESPVLIVKTYDESGINVSGASVGHDAVAIFDENTSDQIILNEFYEADNNTFKRGMFRYPVSQLTEGEHSVKVKVWDINNNITEGKLSFFVSNSAELSLKHVLNYPNPFTSKTSFYFEHNQENQELYVQVQVFTVSGKLVKTIRASCSANGYRSMPITWDGRDDYGGRIGRGVYVYKLRVRNEKGQTAHKMEKLVVLK